MDNGDNLKTKLTPLPTWVHRLNSKFYLLNKKCKPLRFLSDCLNISMHICYIKADSLCATKTGQFYLLPTEGQLIVQVAAAVSILV